MLSSNSLAYTTTSSGTGPRPEEAEAPRSSGTGPAAYAIAGASLAPSRYGADRKPDLPAAALTLMFSAILIAALIQTNDPRPQSEAARLAVVSLSAALPPPPPAPPEDVAQNMTQQPPQSQVAAAPPLAPAPSDPPPLLASPAPSPAPPAPVAPSPASPAPPAPAPAVQADDLATRILSGAPPIYPRESRRRREEGIVVLALTLDPDGSVAAISVAESSGFDRLDEAALRAVRKWRWAPTIRGGQAVKVKGLVEIPFILRGRNP